MSLKTQSTNKVSSQPSHVSEEEKAEIVENMLKAIRKSDDPAVLKNEIARMQAEMDSLKKQVQMPEKQLGQTPSQIYHV